ncbi:MAG: transcriptional regulator [Alphaproteobacteria bacterium]|nr:transcriptional regulator [Alphaproteobacteria bacterium]
MSAAAHAIALLRERLDAPNSGDLATGKAILRNYINATIGFQRLALAVGTPPKSLMRMLSPAGNPRADNLFAVARHLQRQEKVRELRVRLSA